jgi:hypothetical protein
MIQHLLACSGRAEGSTCSLIRPPVSVSAHLRTLEGREGYRITGSLYPSWGWKVGSAMDKKGLEGCGQTQPWEGDCALTACI